MRNSLYKLCIEICLFKYFLKSVIQNTPKMALIFFTFACFVVTVSSECRVVINEVNKIEKIPEKTSFVELKSICSDVPLRGYKLIGLECFGTSGKVNLVVNLWNQRIKSNYFTVGGHETHPDLNIPSDNIRFTSGFKSSKNKVQSVSNFFVQRKLVQLVCFTEKKKRSMNLNYPNRREKS